MGTVDFESIPGWNGAGSPPNDHAEPTFRRWSVNRFYNGRYGGYLGPGGLTQLRSLHPMRAFNVMGDNITIPPSPFEYISPSLPVDENETALDVVTGLPLAADKPIRFRCETNVNFQTGEAILIVNGVVQEDQLFLGAPNLDGVYSDSVDVRDWENLLGGTGQASVQFVNTSGIIEINQSYWFQFTINYQAASVPHQQFANEEVTFVHRTIGFLRRGDGLAEPVGLFKNSHDSGPSGDVKTSIGVAWAVKDGEPPDVGRPSMTVLVLPQEIPELQEVVFSAYQSTCGVPK